MLELEGFPCVIVCSLTKVGDRETKIQRNHPVRKENYISCLSLGGSFLSIGESQEEQTSLVLCLWQT